MTIGEAIRDLRAVVGLSQADLAYAMGHPRRQGQHRVSRWELDIQEPSATTLLAIEDAVGVERGTILVMTGDIDPFALVAFLDTVGGNAP